MYLFSDHMGMKDQVIISMSGGGYVGLCKTDLRLVDDFC